MTIAKKFLAVVLSVLTLLSVCAFSASAANAPEVSLTIVSETPTTVVVRLTLEKGECNAFDATFVTSSAIRKCTEINVAQNACEFFMSNPDEKKFAATSLNSVIQAKRVICDATFEKKTSAAISNSDIKLNVTNCAITETIDGRVVNTDITNLVKVNVNFKTFILNSKSYTVNYKDSFAISCETNYPAEDLTWTSSDEGVVKVDENGNVYASGKGNATITVTSADGYVNETCDVEVKYSFGQWLIVIFLFGWIWY